MQQSNNIIHIGAHGRTELAQMYYPHLCPARAWVKLKTQIRETPGLFTRLTETGYTTHRRTFTPLQVTIIYEAIGEP